MTIGVKPSLAEVLASFLQTLYTKEHEAFAREIMLEEQIANVIKNAGNLIV